MKKSLFGALLLFVLAACSPRMETVVILSTNDIHAHIEKFPQLAEAVKKCRDTVKNVILVDAGDRWTGNVYCDRAAEPRRPIIDLMNRLRYDVATFGNHEFDAGQAFLGVRTAQCRFPVVCANIVSDTATFPQPAPYAIVERGGRRIGFVASVTNYDHNNHPAGHDENFAGLTFTDAMDAVADRQSLRDECDALVALTHIGTKKDRVLAEKAPRYDVIVGGHSHDETNETVGGVLVTQTGKNLDNVGVTVLRFRGDELVEKSFRLVPLAGYEPAPAYQRMVEGYYSDPALRTKVADLRGRLDKTGLANVFTEAVREAGRYLPHRRRAARFACGRGRGGRYLQPRSFRLQTGDGRDDGRRAGAAGEDQIQRYGQPRRVAPHRHLHDHPLCDPYRRAVRGAVGRFTRTETRPPLPRGDGRLHFQDLFRSRLYRRSSYRDAVDRRIGFIFARPLAAGA